MTTYLGNLLDDLQDLANYRIDDHSIAGEAREEIKRLRAELESKAKYEILWKSMEDLKPEILSDYSPCKDCERAEETTEWEDACQTCELDQAISLRMVAQSRELELRTELESVYKLIERFRTEVAEKDKEIAQLRKIYDDFVHKDW